MVEPGPQPDFDVRPELQPLALFLYSISVISMLGVTFITPVLPAIIAAFDITSSQAGLLITAFTLPGVIFVPVFGWLADRMRRTIVLTAALVLFGVAGTAVFLVRDFNVILGLRFVQGIGASGILPIIRTMIGDLYEDETEVGVQGYRVVSLNISKFIYPVLGGVLAGIAWNIPFLLYLTAIPAGLVVIFNLPESAPADETSLRYREIIATTVRETSIAIGFGITFTRMFLKYSIYTFLPLLVTQFGIGTGKAGFVLSVISLALAVTATQASRLAGIVGSYELIGVIGLVCLGLVTIVFGVLTSFILFIVVATIHGLVEGFIAPLETSLLTQNSPPEARASVVSLRAVIGNIAKTAAPLMFGVAAQRVGLQAAFMVVSGGVVVAGLVLLLFYTNRARTKGPIESL